MRSYTQLLGPDATPRSYTQLIKAPLGAIVSPTELKVGDDVISIVPITVYNSFGVPSSTRTVKYGARGVITKVTPAFVSFANGDYTKNIPSNFRIAGTASTIDLIKEMFTNNPIVNDSKDAVVAVKEAGKAVIDSLPSFTTLKWIGAGVGVVILGAVFLRIRGSLRGPALDGPGGSKVIWIAGGALVLAGGAWYYMKTKNATNTQAQDKASSDQSNLAPSDVQAELRKAVQEELRKAALLSSNPYPAMPGVQLNSSMLPVLKKFESPAVPTTPNLNPFTTPVAQAAKSISQTRVADPQPTVLFRDGSTALKGLLS